MLLAFIFIFLAGEANAKQSHLTCSVDKMEIIYVAGGGAKSPEDTFEVVSDLALLLVPESELSDKGISFAEPIYSKFGYLDSQELEKSFLEVKELGLNFPDDETIYKAVRLGAIDWQRGVQFVKFFNPLFWTKSVKTLALLGGAVVTGGISAHKSINTLSSRISINLISQKKSLVVTHGLGQQVFNLAYSNLLKGPRKDELGYVSGIALGMLSSILPPSPADNPRFHYVVNRGDEILRSNTFANVKPNAYFDGPNPDDIGHDIIKTYFSDAYVNTSLGRIRMLDFTREQIKRSVAGLLNNDPECCEKRQGKLWVNESGCEEGQETCFGGFLEKTVKLNLDSDDELELSRDSVICGDVQIESNQNTVKIENTKLIGPATIKGDVVFKNVKLDASGPDLNYDRAIIDGENQFVKIDFTGSDYTQPNILGRPQITDSVDIKSSQSEAVITGSPTIRNRVTLNNSKIKEVYPPTEVKKLTSQIILDGEFGVVQLTDTSLEGKVNITGPVMMSEVTQKGTASIQRANFIKTKLTNSYYSTNSKPGIKVLNGTSCSSQLSLGNAVINDEADIQACGDIYDSARMTGHVQIKGKVSIGGLLQGDGYLQGVDPMMINGNIGNGIVISNEAKIYNRPKIEGSLFIDGLTEIYQNGSYKGVTQIVGSGGTEVSHIKDAILQGNNMKMSGLYYVETAMLDAEVVGGYAELSSPADWLTTTVFQNTAIEPEAKIKGLVVIKNGARLGYRSIAEGKKLGSKGGVTLDVITLFTGEGKTVEGGVYLGGADVDGANIKSNVTDRITTFTSGVMRNGEIESGYGTISGGSSLIGARIFGGTGYRIESAQLNGTSVTGSAYLCSKTYGVFTYDSSYDCTLDETVIPYKTGEQLMLDAREEARRKVQYENHKSNENRKRIAGQMAMKLKLLKIK